MKTPITIATRQSPLALWQAEYVKSALEKHHPGIAVELLKMTTKGDKILDAPLAKVGGKGLFVKELEIALLEGRADIAVHSMKDVPVDFPPGLGLAVICEREDPRDAFVANNFADLDELPPQSTLGTSSLRRQCQIAALRPDLDIRDLRGNVGTRLSKLDQGEYDAILLAAAGLKRLEQGNRIRSYLNTDQCLPACGQGAVGIECRLDDNAVLTALAPLNDEDTYLRVKAERAMNHRLQGGCQVPIGGFATLMEDQTLNLTGLVGSLDGTRIIRAVHSGPATEAEQIGVALADKLLAQGAADILATLQQSS